MSIRLGVLGVALALAACKPAASDGRKSRSGRATATADEDGVKGKGSATRMTEKEEAANESFLEDSLDEEKGKAGQNEGALDAGADDVVEAELDKPEEEVADAIKDETAEDDVTVDDVVTAEDTKPGRLRQMAQMLLDKADKDDSGTLSKAEFKSGRFKGAAKWQKKRPKLAEGVEKRRGQLFDEYAGDDEELDEDELVDLLKASRPWVKERRKGEDRLGEQERLDQAWKDILAEFDGDDDGLLNQSEYEAIQAAGDKRWRKWQDRAEKKKQRQKP